MTSSHCPLLCHRDAWPWWDLWGLLGPVGHMGSYGDLWQHRLPHGNTFPPPKIPWGALGTHPVPPQGPNKHEDGSPQPRDTMGTAGSGCMGTIEEELRGT